MFLTCDSQILRGDIEKLCTVEYIGQDNPLKWPDYVGTFVNEHSSVLVENRSNSAAFFEIKKVPNHFIAGISIVTECQKIEIFMGEKILEYSETIYGTVIDNFEGVTLYRYDIPLKSQKPNLISLKFIHSSQFWVYGLYIVFNPNPNSEQSSFEQSINYENVENMLSSSTRKLTPNAEKCKSFIKTFVSSSKNAKSPPNMQMLMSMFNSNLVLKEPSVTESASQEEVSKLNGDNKDEPGAAGEFKTLICNNALKEYIDLRITELESRINEKLVKIELNQNQKFDRIIHLLESINSANGH